MADKDFKDKSSDRVRQLLGLNYEYPKITYFFTIKIIS